MKLFDVKQENGKVALNIFGVRISIGSNRFSVNKRIKDADVVHIMFNDKFNKPFVDMLNRNFDPSKHLVLCKRWFDSEATPFPEGKNVVEIKKLKNYNLNNAKKIICHSLFDSELVDLLHKTPALLKKSYWAMWGGDLYKAPRDKQNDFVRKNLKGYINAIDKDYAIDKYGMEGLFFDAQYNFPITKQMLDNSTKENSDGIKIQINNSCDSSTIEILEMISKFKDENIKVVTILSYGDLSYKEEIISRGRNILGKKFEYVDKMMPPNEYAQHLAQNDILILNQNRQQGLGNILASLYMGQKVFIRKEVSVNGYLNNQDIKILY